MDCEEDVYEEKRPFPFPLLLPVLPTLPLLAVFKPRTMWSLTLRYVIRILSMTSNRCLASMAKTWAEDNIPLKKFNVNFKVVQITQVLSDQLIDDVIGEFPR